MISTLKDGKKNELRDFTGLRLEIVRYAQDVGCNAKDGDHEQKRMDEPREFDSKKKAESE